MLCHNQMDADTRVRREIIGRHILQAELRCLLHVFERLLDSFTLAIAALQRRINSDTKAILVLFYNDRKRALIHRARQNGT